jgi:hypothetical protein
MGNEPSRSASLPGGITVTPTRAGVPAPHKPRAASRAASGLEAMATLASRLRMAARSLIAREISGSDPNRDSMPARSMRTVSQAVSSMQGENDCAQSSKAAWAEDSCRGERGRKASSEHNSAWDLVMPGAMPRRLAFSLTAIIFSSGGLPSRMATARGFSSGSARRAAATRKFGT